MGGVSNMGDAAAIAIGCVGGAALLGYGAHRIHKNHEKKKKKAMKHQKEVAQHKREDEYYRKEQQMRQQALNNDLRRIEADHMKNQGQPLPPGWVEMRDQGGRVYYWNKQSNQTSWERPGGSARMPPPPPAPLPPGWVETKDQGGRVYYWHQPSNTTSWERPMR